MNIDSKFVSIETAKLLKQCNFNILTAATFTEYLINQIDP